MKLCFDIKNFDDLTDLSESYCKNLKINRFVGELSDEVIGDHFCNKQKKIYVYINPYNSLLYKIKM